MCVGMYEDDEFEMVVIVIVKVIEYMGKCRIGVLIILLKEIGMGDYVEMGILFNVNVLLELFINIFILNIFFYDGVVIM